MITQHAYLEMEDDRLEWEDVKQALLNGKVRRKEVDLRGTKDIVVGQSCGKEIGVVGHFAENNRF